MDAFKKILHGNVEKYSQVHAAYNSLCAYPGQITRYLEDEMNSTDLQTHFDIYIQRLVDFFAHIRKSSSGNWNTPETRVQALAEQLLKLTATLLADEFAGLATRIILDRIIIVSLQLALAQSCPGLRSFVSRLLSTVDVFESIVAHEHASIPIKEVFDHPLLSKDTAVFQSCARSLVKLCESCSIRPACHGLAGPIERCHRLLEIVAAGEAAKNEYRFSSSKVLLKDTRRIGTPFGKVQGDNLNDALYAVPADVAVTFPALPDTAFGKVQEDNIDDALYAAPADVAVTFPALPDTVVASIKEFGFCVPHSARTLDVLLEQIGVRDIPEIVRVLLRTFPCRQCYTLKARPENPHLEAPRLRQEHSSLDPIVQNTIFGEEAGLWKVLLSAEALKDFQRQVSGGAFWQLEAKLNKLASGDWKGGKFSTIVGTHSQKKYFKWPLLKANAGKKLRILWQIDVGYCEDGVHRQHVKIWRIVDRKDVSKVIEHVVTVNKTRLSHSNLDASLCRPVADASGIFLPAEGHRAGASSPSDEPVRADAPTSISVNDRRSIELYHKFYEYTKPLLECCLSGNLLAEFPFDTSPQEIEVISHGGSGTLIMGRSGTGKTTCLVQKLVRNYAAPRKVLGETRTQQLLLTRSSYLCEELKMYTKRLIESQLLTPVIGQAAEGMHALTLGEESAMSSKTLISLSTDDFPLVCTFDQLLRLLENTIENANRKNFRDLKLKEARPTRPGEYVRRSQVVDFNLFRSEYWERLPRSLTKHHEPGLVFSEFMGIIKGFASSEKELGTLTREQYKALSHKRAPTYSSYQREEVYDLFEFYEREKKRYGDRDGIDRVMALLKVLSNNIDAKAMLENVFEELYVDEVQDHRCVDILLLLKLVKNPRGIHLAGDTAQCISKDSTFRFADVKALFYEQFSSLASMTGEKTLALPVMFKLNKNFRSHQGIISLASFVMKLLYTCFPQTVDRMDEEHGQYSGPIPVFVVGLGVEDLRLGLSEDVGAEQVVLVRDDLMKRKIQEHVGDTILVLTILDSKGMEFGDVLLFDFFTSSPCGSWQQASETLLDVDGDGTKLGGNALLCSELKHLYVAITRARNQLFVFESSAEAAEPILNLLTHDRSANNPLVDVVHKGHPLFNEKLKMLMHAASSDPLEFSEMGHQLLGKNLSHEARQYFRKAKDERGINIAEAHILVNEGRGHRANGAVERFMECFRKAARLFRLGSQLANAAYCLEEIGCLEMAADILADLGLEHNIKAAQLYECIGVYSKASKCYDAAQRYDSAAAALRNGELFDNLVKYIATNHERLDLDQALRYRTFCFVLVKQERVNTNLQEVVVNTFGDDDDREGILRRFRMTDHLVDLLTRREKYGEAFRELLSEGKLRSALVFALKHSRIDEVNRESDILTLVNYTIYENIIRSSRDGTAVLWDLGANVTISPQLDQSIRQWQIVQDIIKPGLGKSTSIYENLVSEFHKDVAALHTTFHSSLTDFDGATSLTELDSTCEALRRVVTIWSSIKTDFRTLPAPVSVVLGAFPQPVRQEMLLLDYSPLGEQGIRRTDTIRVINKARKLLLEHATMLCAKLHEVCTPLWIAQLKAPCSRQFYSGRCRTDDCQRSHKTLSSTDYRSRVTQLKNMCLLICSFDVVYRHTTGEVASDKGLNDFLGAYAKNRRFWLEHLLRELIFRSAVEHDPIVASGTFRTFVAERQKYGILLKCLENLLFFRLRRDREWSLRCDFSSLLEQIQLSEMLGRYAADRFLMYVLRPTGGRDSLAGYQAMAAYHLQHAVFSARRNNVNNFKQNLQSGLDAVGNLEAGQFTNFHAVIGIFERLALFLYVKVCTSTCLLPQSWLELHLPAVQGSCELGSTNKAIFSDCLRDLLDAFVRLLAKLDSDPIRFTYGTRKGVDGDLVKAYSFEDGIAERNRNFLIIALINLSALNAPLPDSSSILGKIKQVLTEPSRTALSHGYRTLGIISIATQLWRSFTRFNGKDHLVMLTSTVEHFVSHYNIRQYLESLGVRTLRSQELLHPELSATQNAAGPGDNDQENQPLLLSAVCTIQRFWRKRSRYLNSHRCSLETIDGRLSEWILDHLVRPHLARPVPDRVQKNIVLFTTGLEVYRSLSGFAQWCRKYEAWGGSLMMDRNARTESLEELDAVLVNLRGLRKELESAEECISENKVRVLYISGTSEEIQKVFEEVRETIADAVGRADAERRVVEIFEKAKRS